MPLEFSRVTISTPLVPLDEMKIYLRITDTDHDDDVKAMSAEAQDAILAYLMTGADATWTPTTAPLSILKAIKLLTYHFYENRGAIVEDKPDADVDGKVREALANLLSPFRDPTLA
jgi:uncharacterized phage protein (predicted DNA packaging)